MKFSRAGLKLVALDMLREGGRGNSPLWTAYPTLSADVAERDPEVVFVRLLADGVPGAKSSVARSVTLVVGTADGDSLVWCFDVRTGQTCSATGAVAHIPGPTPRLPSALSAFSALANSHVAVAEEGAFVAGARIRSLAVQPPAGGGATKEASLLQSAHSIVSGL